METDEQGSEQKERDFGTPVTCGVGAGVWWFLSSHPSTLALIIVGVLLAYLCLAFCLLALQLPGPHPELTQASFAPLPQSESNRPKSLTI